MCVFLLRSLRPVPAIRAPRGAERVLSTFSVRAQYRHCVRAVKEMDSKSIGLCPQGFESPRCRSCSLLLDTCASESRRTNLIAIDSCSWPVLSAVLLTACVRGGAVEVRKYVQWFRKSDPGRTRTCNLWFRGPTPYPLGHRAGCHCNAPLAG